MAKQVLPEQIMKKNLISNIKLMMIPNIYKEFKCSGALSKKGKIKLF